MSPTTTIENTHELTNIVITELNCKINDLDAKFTFIKI